MKQVTVNTYRQDKYYPRVVRAITKILSRYDKDSNPIEKHVTEREKLLYLKEIKKDITYFNRTYKRADISVHISGLGPEQAVKKVKEMLDKHWQEGSRNQKKLSEQRAAADS
jgi:hypothetical protein